MQESHLFPQDLKNASLAVHRERRKDHPVLPKRREDVHTAVSEMTIETNKSEQFLLINDQDNGILIYSSHTNLECMCNDMSELFIDGTFKFCPKYFYQMYTLHGKTTTIFLFSMLFYQPKMRNATALCGT